MGDAERRKSGLRHQLGEAELGLVEGERRQRREPFYLSQDHEPAASGAAEALLPPLELYGAVHVPEQEQVGERVNETLIAELEVAHRRAQLAHRS
jgi:hypothetical protein